MDANPSRARILENRLTRDVPRQNPAPIDQVAARVGMRNTRPIRRVGCPWANGRLAPRARGRRRRRRRRRAGGVFRRACRSATCAASGRARSMSPARPAAIGASSTSMIGRTRSSYYRLARACGVRSADIAVPRSGRTGRSCERRPESRGDDWAPASGRLACSGGKAGIVTSESWPGRGCAGLHPFSQASTSRGSVILILA
jgi:hypothetical protein